MGALQDFGLATDGAEAAAVALNAGVDQDLCVSAFEHLPEALERGLVTAKALDSAVGNILRQKFAAGLFEGAWKVADPKSLPAKLDTYRPVKTLLPSSDSSWFPSISSRLPLVFGCSNVAC